jgi:hypothetical protein
MLSQIASTSARRSETLSFRMASMSIFTMNMNLRRLPTEGKRGAPGPQMAESAKPDRVAVTRPKLQAAAGTPHKHPCHDNLPFRILVLSHPPGTLFLSLPFAYP